MTEKEVGQYTGLLDEPDGTYNGGKQFTIPHIDFANTPIPQSLDWRDYGRLLLTKAKKAVKDCSGLMNKKIFIHVC